MIQVSTIQVSTLGYNFFNDAEVCYNASTIIGLRDQILAACTQWLWAGAIVGCIIGIGIGYLIAKRKWENGEDL